MNFKTFIDEKYGFGASLLGAYHRGKKSVSYDGETANLSNVSYHSLMGTLDLYFNPLPKQDNYIPYLMLFGGARSYKVSGDIDVDGWKYSVDRLTNGSGVYGLGLGFVTKPDGGEGFYWGAELRYARLMNQMYFEPDSILIPTVSFGYSFN